MDDFIARRARAQVFNLKPYVPGKPIDEVKRELGLTDVIKMASNENPLGPAPLAKQAIIEHLDDIHIYPDSYCFELKAMLAARLNIGPECIAIGNGSDEILKMLAEAFINPGDEVILAYPTFAEYELVSTVMGLIASRFLCAIIPMICRPCWNRSARAPSWYSYATPIILPGRLYPGRPWASLSESFPGMCCW